MKSSYHGGVVARNWRRGLSAYANSMGQTTRTYKFPSCPKTRSWSQSIDQEQAGNCRISAEEAAEWPGTELY